jgi:hypothetical protein
MKVGDKKPADSEDDVDDIDDDDESDVVSPPVAPVVSESQKLPPGYEYREFFRINGMAVRFRHRGTAGGTNTPSIKYNHGELIPKESAPSTMVEAANNPAKTCLDPEDGKLKYYVELVRRIVKVDESINKTGVIHVEGGEVPFTPPPGPNTRASYQPMRPEQVIVRGLQAKVEAKKAAAEAGAAKK